MRRRPTIALLGSLCLSGSAFAAFEIPGGIRAAGMGQAFTALASDPSAAFYNPAGLQGITLIQFSTSYTRPYLGIDEVGISDQYLGVAYPFGKLGTLALAGVTTGDEIYREYDLAFSYGVGVWQRGRLSLGLTGRRLSKGFSFSALHPQYQHEVVTDPIFLRGGASNANYSLDAGLLFRVNDRLQIGLAAFNLLEPNLALNKLDKDPAARRYRLGVGYLATAYRFDVDAEYEALDVGGSAPIRILAGAEADFLNQRLQTRAGIRDNATGEGRATQAALGLSFEFLRREWRDPGFDLLDGKEYTYIRRLRVSIDTAWEYAVPIGELYDSGLGAPPVGLPFLYDTSKVYQKFMNRRQLEEALKKKKEQVAFEVAESLSKHQASLLESERKKIEAALQEKFESERKLLQKEIEERASLEAEKESLEKEAKNQGLEQELNEQVRRLEEVIRDKNVVIQRSTRTNEALRHLVQAVGHYFAGDYESAENECLVAIDIAPYLELSFVRLGSIYVKQGRVDEAIAAWERALQIEPGNAELREWLEALKTGH